MNGLTANNDKGMDAILQGVGLLIDSNNKKSPFDKTLSGIITKADYETNTYSVKINGYEYQNIISTIKVNVNDSVMVTCPQNQLSQMYISNKIDTTNYLDTSPKVYTQDTTVKATEDIKGVLTDSVTLTLKLEAGCMYMLYGVSYTLSTGAVGNYSLHFIYPSLLDAGTLTVPVKLHGTSNLPFTVAQTTNQTLTLKNLGVAYNAHFALKKIY